MSYPFTQWDNQFLLNQVAKIRTEAPPRFVSEWIEGRRILPGSTPFPGLWFNSRTPFWVELMDDLAPGSPIHFTANMKAAQMGATAVAENGIAFYIGCCPADILYVSATEELLRKWSAQRLEHVIDSCGLRDRITNLVSESKARRAADKVLSKTFYGGTLNMASLNSAPSLRMNSVFFLILDEIDGADEELSTGEGSATAVAEARTAAFGNRAKIFANSTPTVEGNSAIHSLYLDGDQRNFFVPCPRCGAEQVLKWGNEHTQYGVKPEKKAGLLVDAHYICDHCHDAFHNHEKEWFLSRGVWRPTAKSSSASYRSRTISGLYRPIGMRSWAEMYELYEKALKKPERMRGFVNLELGKPYKEQGGRPPVERVYELRGGYKSGTVPDGVLFLTAAIDVQQGSKRGKPARLEMEVCGHGADWRTWSIDYKVFTGNIWDESDGAWALLEDYAKEGGMVYTRDDGVQFPVKMTFIDSGDGNVTDIVYRFCEGWQDAYPCKGGGALRKPKKGDPSDPLQLGEHHRKWRQSTAGGNVFYIIATTYYKTQLYLNFRKRYRGTGPTPRGYCQFPVDYPNEYFEQITAEEKLVKGGFEAYGRPHEALDTRVYNLCAADVVLTTLLKQLQMDALQQGMSKVDAARIDYKMMFQMLEKSTKRVPLKD